MVAKPVVPEAKLSRVYQWALVIDEQELRRLVDECRRSIAEGTNAAPESVELELDLKFSDGLSYKAESLDRVLTEENPRTRSISGLQLRMSIPIAEILCRFGLELEGASSIIVKSWDRQWVYVTLSRIEERLRRMKQWHPRAKNTFWLLSIGALGAWLGLGWLRSIESRLFRPRLRKLERSKRIHSGASP